MQEQNETDQAFALEIQYIFRLVIAIVVWLAIDSLAQICEHILWKILHKGEM